MNRFLEEKKDNWQRLEDLLTMLSGSSLRSLSRVEVREFGELYRRAAADLAIARAETRDAKLINYLNSLVIRAHGKIYRAESDGFGLIWKFFAQDFPAAFRSARVFILVAFLVFTVSAFISGWLSFNDPEFAVLIGVEETADAARSNKMWWLSLNEANQVGASQILTNNIRVAFLAFAWGALLGLGSFYILMMNGVSIGGVVGACYRGNTDFANELMTFMVGHGVIELSTIFMAGGAGMMIGYAFIDPGDLTRAQALKKKGMEAAKIVFGCACLLVVAGVIEGFLSPSALPAPYKIATGVFTGIVMYSYLMMAGRDPLPVNEDIP
ncbi:MAG: stage II sporulation protein M [Pyrinomonadaceae bacterium]|nr:stage II sporulation protein M [Pyrinomonadaceae bacterium]